LITIMMLMGMKWSVPFLCLNRPVAAQVLIVEGWLPDYALEGAVAEFHRGGYRYVITAGSPLLSGYYFSEVKTSAHLAAISLVKLGLSTNLVIPVPGPPVLRERSLAHAKAVQEWIHTHDPNVHSVNVYTLGVHARRSRMLFQKVLGDNMEVGIIACPDAAYEENQWWKTSEGLKTVSGEVLAYVWACFSDI
jgi:hypothetical protein